MTRRVLVDMNVAEANKLRRLMMHLQSARQLDQFISASAWAYRAELVDLVDREVLAAQTAWHTWLDAHEIDRTITFQVDFDHGQVYVDEEEASDGSDSEPVDELGAGAANDGVQRDGE